MILRYVLLPFLLVSTQAIGAQPSNLTFDPVAFQKRFEKADINKDGKLTRDEAFAEFPRMPEFFDEIDANGDGAITLKEVRAAMQKRVNAAMDNSKAGSRYVIPKQPDLNAPPPDSSKQYFSSRQAAQRYYRLEYYESIAKHQHGDSLPSAPTETIQAPAQFRKEY